MGSERIMNIVENFDLFAPRLINKKELPYGFGLNTKRAEAFWKNGIMFKDKPLYIPFVCR